MEALLAALQAGGGGAAAAIAAAVVLLAALYFARMGSKERANTPPVVPGLPLIGNLLQLDEKMPHKTFAKWSEIYGPIYTIRTGASSVVVLNSTEVAKEAMVAKFTSISTRKLAKAFSVLSRDKTMVATSDYGEFHTKAKRFIREGLLGSSAQRRFRDTRQKMMDNMLNTFHSLVIGDPHAPQNFREVFRDEMFRVTLIESLGEDVSSVYVKEFGREISKEEMHRTMVFDMMSCVIVADWRDHFPYLGWLPNKSFDTRLVTAESRRTAVIRALIDQRRERIACGESRVSYSYLDFLLAQNTLTDEVLTMLVWEAILELTDTTSVTTEWAMYELAKKPKKQDRLYQEIQEVCGEDTVVTEDHLPRLPYLNAVFHETLRLHPPISVLPRRFVHQTTTLGGYKIPAGTEVTINVYGCNMNKEEWEEPEEWRPERFLDGRFDSADMFKTLSFGAGKRVCAGSVQAINISCAAIARLVQEFAWRLKKGDKDEENAVQFVGHKLHPLYVYLSPRGGR
ncbi:ent-kaurene oxidase 2 [Lolium perenne]|uniref:ent-kaurene oxidase 2 n=1 Tax=Lolium perenne TaxID=4522 RepID=UPI0021F66BAA|nr:ent-kaurene oxidase-like 3 [Lolium perenne]